MGVADTEPAVNLVHHHLLLVQAVLVLLVVLAPAVGILVLIRHLRIITLAALLVPADLMGKPNMQQIVIAGLMILEDITEFLLLYHIKLFHHSLRANLAHLVYVLV